MPLRLALADDAAFLAEVYNAAIAQGTITADLEPVSATERAAWLVGRKPGRPCWIVEDEGRALGYATLSDFYGRPGYAATAELGLYLHPAAQGRKAGAEALALLKAEAAGLGIITLLAFVFMENAPGYRFFIAQGFEPWGLLPEVARHPDGIRSLLILGLRV